MRYEKLWLWIILSLAIHAAVFGVFIYVHSAYRDSMVLMEQGASCVEVELVGFNRSAEGLSSEKKSAGTEKRDAYESPTLPGNEDVLEKTVFQKENSEDLRTEELITLDKVQDNSNEANASNTGNAMNNSPVIDIKQEKRLSHKRKDFTKGNTEGKKDNHHEINPSVHSSPGAYGSKLVKGSPSAKVAGIGKPEYPKECISKGHEGKVEVEIIILSDGSNGGMTIVESSGCKHMDASALVFLKKCTLVPKMIMGVPAVSKKKIAFRFKITEAANEKEDRQLR